MLASNYDKREMVISTAVQMLNKRKLLIPEPKQDYLMDKKIIYFNVLKYVDANILR